MSGDNAPVGVFDSGIGGLTVVRELIKALPRENIVYLGDTARVPYGIRSPETVRRYAREGAEFLFSKGIKLLVVACNTMSAVGFDAAAREPAVPAIGVIRPGAVAAVSATKEKKVGVIGTEATIKSGAYTEAIRKMDSTVEVFPLTCPLFVPLVEEGWLDGEVPSLVAAKYLDGLKGTGVDVLVLGCTHYPLLKPVISKVLGGDIVLIDSAAETAREVREKLLESGRGREGDAPASREFYVTDDPGKFVKIGGRFLGKGIGEVKNVRLEVSE